MVCVHLIARNTAVGFLHECLQLIFKAHIGGSRLHFAHATIVTGCKVLAGRTGFEAALIACCSGLTLGTVEFTIAAFTTAFAITALTVVVETRLTGSGLGLCFCLLNGQIHLAAVTDEKAKDILIVHNLRLVV